MMRTLMKGTGVFLLSFWKEESSQMTKMAVMSLGSVIAAIVFAATPSVVGAEPCTWLCVAKGNCYYWQYWCQEGLRAECQSCCYCQTCDDGPGCQ